MMFLGIDGGGSRLRATLISHAGEVLGAGEAGKGNPKAVGPGAVRSAMLRATADAWKGAGVDPRPADGAFMGLAGVASEGERRAFKQIGLELELAPVGQLRVDHDLRIALAGGLAGRPGIVIVAGTGSASFGRMEDGRSGRSGGWGWRIDDPGSAFWLGVRALRAVARSADGRGRATVLTERVLEFLELDDVLNLPTRLHVGSGMERDEIAALAPLLVAAAEKGDGVAVEILREGCDELAVMAAATAESLRVSSEPIEVVLVGGVGCSGELVFEFVREALTRVLPSALLRRPMLPPVIGACLLAAEFNGLMMDRKVVDRLRSTWNGPAAG